MRRQTSLDAYHEIKENGLLGKRQLEVYEILFHHGPMSSNDAFHLVKAARGGRLNCKSDVRARFTDLYNCGVLSAVGEKVDLETGMRVTVWDLTDRLPIKKTKTKRTPCKHCGGKGYHETDTQLEWD